MQDILKIGHGILSMSLMLGMSAVGGDDGVFDPVRDMAFAEIDAARQEQLLAERQMLINNVLDATPGDWCVSFDETPISDVVAYLRGELGKRGLGAININYNPPSDPVGESVPEPTVTAVLSGVTLRELLITICKNAGCVFNVTDSGIDVYRQDDPASRIVETRTWCDVPLSFFPGVDVGRTMVDMTEYLMQLGLKFDVKGATAYYDPRLNQLTVTGTLEDLDKVDAFIHAARLRFQGETE